MSEAGMTIREDPMGNIWGRWAGSNAEAGSCRLPVNVILRAMLHAAISILANPVRHSCQYQAADKTP